MTDTQEHGTAALAAVSNAMVALHKEQFGRGPTRARANFAGADSLMCVLEDALLPAERKLVEMGEQNRVRESRVAFQAATQEEFVEAVERIVLRKVIAFDSGAVFECFQFSPLGSGRNGNGTLATEHADGRDQHR